MSELSKRMHRSNQFNNKSVNRQRKRRRVSSIANKLNLAKVTYWSQGEDKLLLFLMDGYGNSFEKTDKVPIEVFREILPDFNGCGLPGRPFGERSAGSLQNRYRLLQKKRKNNEENMSNNICGKRKKRKKERQSPLSPLKAMLNTKRRKIESNHSELDWKENALKIINILVCDDISEPFRRKVDEIRDEAPGYNKIIAEPMDLGTLKSELLHSNKNLDLRQYFYKLLLIWKNAQEYNSAQFEIHRHAVQLEAKSHKLLKEFWPVQYEEYNQTNRRKSRRIRKAEISQFAYPKYDENGVRDSLNCGICDNEMKFCVGFDVHCNDKIQCNECKKILDDAFISYYHCNECNVTLCGMCWHKYESSTIVLKECDARGIAFRGLFCGYTPILVDDDNENTNEWRPWFEAILMVCDAQKMFYRLVYSTENDKRYFIKTSIKMSENEMKFEKVQNEKKGEFDNGYLSMDGLELVFIGNDDPLEKLKYKKCREFCQKCGEEMLFLTKRMLPNDKCQTIYCDVHDQIYEKQKLLPQSERCASFEYVNKSGNDDEIYENDFYFSCIHCNDFDQCNLCTLIKNECLLAEKYGTEHTECIDEEESECKESSIETLKVDELKQELADEQEKVCQIYNELQSVKEENEQLIKDKNEWKDKYKMLNEQYRTLKETLSNLGR